MNKLRPREAWQLAQVILRVPSGGEPGIRVGLAKAQPVPCKMLTRVQFNQLWPPKFPDSDPRCSPIPLTLYLPHIQLQRLPLGRLHSDLCLLEGRRQQGSLGALEPRGLSHGATLIFPSALPLQPPQLLCCSHGTCASSPGDGTPDPMSRHEEPGKGRCKGQTLQLKRA